MKRFLIASAAAVLVTSVPTAVMAQEPAAQNPIIVNAKEQRKWDKGSKLEADGLAKLQSARTDLIKASAKVVEAQNKRDSSLARSTNASVKFDSLTAQPPQFTDPKDAADWAKEVEKAASEWAKYADRQGDGSKDLEKAMKGQDKAQKDVASAEKKIEEGRAMMAKAEQASRTSGE